MLLPALKHMLNSCSTWAWLLCGIWDTPVSGIRPVSPALTGTLFTTEPPGKPYPVVLEEHQFNHFRYFFFESNIVLNSTTFSCSVVGFLSLGKSSCMEGVDFKHKERLKEADTIPPTLDSSLCLPTSTWYNLFLQDPVLLRSTRG